MGAGEHQQLLDQCSGEALRSNKGLEGTGRQPVEGSGGPSRKRGQAVDWHWGTRKPLWEDIRGDAPYVSGWVGPVLE